MTQIVTFYEFIKFCHPKLFLFEESMKKSLPLLLILLSSLFVGFCSGAFAAANPTEYISLNKFYPRVPQKADGSLPEYYSFTNDSSTFYGYIGKFRAFIPPGTVLMDLNIIETGKQMAVARFNLPPAGVPNLPPAGYTADSYFTLAELIAHDCWVTENTESSLYITNDAFTTPLGNDEAGWLYVKVGGGAYSEIYDTHFTVRVKSDVYNAWWDSTIQNEAGWSDKVEGVVTYGDPVNPSTQSVLSVTPSDQAVLHNAGTATFDVSNTGTGAMSWTAEVVSDSTTWLSIISGRGTDTGTITCAFEANTSTSLRTGTIRVTALGASGSPVEVTVTQLPPQAEACTATINGNLLLHIPFLTYTNSSSETLSLWADFVYEPNDTSILFKLTGAGFLENPSFSCDASTLASDLKIHIPNVLIRDVFFHSVDLEHSSALSTGANAYFRVTNVGAVP
jgi:hypothetical protein